MKNFYVIAFSLLLIADVGSVEQVANSSTRLAKLTFDVELYSVYDAESMRDEPVSGKTAVVTAKFYESSIKGYFENDGSYRIDYKTDIKFGLDKPQYQFPATQSEALRFFLKNSESGIKIRLFYSSGNERTANKSSSILLIDGTMEGESWSFQDDTDGLEYLPMMVGREYRFYKDSTWELKSGRRGGKGYTGRARLSKFEIIPLPSEEGSLGAFSFQSFSLPTS